MAHMTFEYDDEHFQTNVLAEGEQVGEIWANDAHIHVFAPYGLWQLNSADLQEIVNKMEELDDIYG